jgi:hypothetical protein
MYYYNDIQNFNISKIIKLLFNYFNGRPELALWT